MSTNKQANRLIHEKSPYLLQHAHNPVDWYPWGGEAFARAVSEDKPIFLSIGYSTCHWCHVMERESFEDEEVARVLNKSFIAIKVDREERPDIDHIYMSVCQAMTGHGGWPLTIVMTPDKKPFFAGTYFPKNSRMGHTGLMESLENIIGVWKEQKDTLVESSEKIMKHMEADFNANMKGQIYKEDIHKAFKGYLNSFDSTYGGFGSAPKFPTPHNLSFLLRYWKSTGNSDALNLVEKTLEGMYRGGIYDHIGFGFSRYSTDQRWLVPHFEKMLYDNALLAIAYLETYQATGKQKYARIAEQIFEYVLRDMTSEQGGFYSAEDADSEGEEGKFYVWSPNEIIEILGEHNGKKFCEYYDITTNGNFEGKNIPNIINNTNDNLGEVPSDIEAMRKKIFAAREGRIHPYKDDKTLTAWNGLMIAALALGARVLGNKVYSQAAEKAVSFINKTLRREDGRLLARYRDGEAAYPAYLDDYAFLIWGLIELYEATFDINYIELALELNSDMVKYFYDEGNGGFYVYGSDSEQLVARPKDVYDGATPSGNSVVTLNLLRLGRITGDIDIEEYAQNQFEAFGGRVSSYQMGYSHFLMAVQFAYEKTSEVVIVGDKEESDTKKLLDIINKNFLPYTVLIVKDEKSIDNNIDKLIPFVEYQEKREGKTTAYVCENFACKAPITSVEEFKRTVLDIN